MIIARYFYNILEAFANLLLATLNAYNPMGYSYFLAWWRCVDCLANAVAGGDGMETISSRAAKARAAGEPWGCRLCAILAWITRTDHCTIALQENVGSNAVIPDGE